VENKSYITVKLIKSISGRKKNHIECIKGLGLRKIGDTVKVESTACTRGLINTVSYLLSVEE